MSDTCLSSTGYYFLFAKLYRECQKLLLFPDLLSYMITVLKWAFTYKKCLNNFTYPLTHPCINRLYKSRVTCSLPILLGKGKARHLKSSILFTGLFFLNTF